MMKYGHVPLFFELILPQQWFLITLDILKGFMHVNTIYRDSVYVLYGVAWLQQLKLPIPCHSNNSGM